MYHVNEADMRELVAAEAAVSAIRRELAVSEERIIDIRARLISAETQLSNAIRQLARTIERSQDTESDVTQQ